MMNSKPYWIGYVVLILVVVLSYSAFTFYQVFNHYRLSQATSPSSIQWTLHKQAEDDYRLKSNYRFDWKGNSYTGQLEQSQEYLNEWAGQEALLKAKKKEFLVWFDPENPNFSTLNKDFPIKYSIYTILLWLLFIYFIWLGNSIKKRSY